MASFLIKLLFNILLIGIPALLQRWINKRGAEQTAADVRVEVATAQAEVKKRVDEVNAKPMSPDDAIASLRKRAGKRKG